jgi:hypothetical protein
MASLEKGAPVSITLDGNTFDFSADSDWQHGKPKYKRENLRSTGRTFFRLTIQDTGASGTLRIDNDQLAVLKELAERRTAFPMSVTLRSGRSYSATGFITYESYSEADGTVGGFSATPIDDWTDMGGETA